MFVESETDAPLKVRLNSLDISSQATTENGEARSFGLYSYNNSTVVMKDGSITSSSKSNNGGSTAYGIFSGQNSHVTSGVQSVTVQSSSTGRDTSVSSYGVQASDSSSFVATHPLIKINVTAIADEKVNQLLGYGVNVESDSNVTLNNADITVNTKTDHSIDNHKAYGVSLGGNSSFTMKDGSIRVSATDISKKAFTGDAVGIITNTGSDNYTISLGTVDIEAKGENASGLELANATMEMFGGSINVQASGGQAQGLNANNKTTYTASGDIDVTAHAEGGMAVALQAEGESAITALGGSVTATGDRTAYNSVGAIGLKASSGSSIVKSGGNVNVSSITGHAIGLDAQDNSDPNKTFKASQIVYGNADATTQIEVTGANEGYGIRVQNANVTTSDGESASVELTNGNLSVKAMGSSASAYGAYSNSGNITLKGDTSIKAEVTGESGTVYSLYATGTKSSVITVEQATYIEGDICVASEGSVIRADFKEGGNLKGWTHNQGTLELTFGKNAAWEMVSTNAWSNPNDPKQMASVTELTLDDANIYVGTTSADWHGQSTLSTLDASNQSQTVSELKVGSLSGSGHFYLQTDLAQDISDSVLVTDSLTGTHYLHVKATGQEPIETQTSSYLARTEQNVVTEANAFTLATNQFSDQEVIDLGLYNYRLDSSERNQGREWYLNRTEELSPTAKTVLGLSGMASAYAMHMGQLSNLRERLGEIRYDHAQNGWWGRAFSQENELSGLGGIDFSQKLYGAAIGYDRLLQANNDQKWFIGLRGQMSKAKQEIDSEHVGTGESHSYGLAAYLTWQHDNGWYSDTVLSWDWYDQDLNTRMHDGMPVTASYHTVAGGISQEFGRLFRLQHDVFVEPQMQLSWYWMKGKDFTTTNGMNVVQDDAQSLTGRLGVTLGKTWTLSENRIFQPYFKVGINHEFMGDQRVVDNGVLFEDDLDGTRVYYGLGMDWQFARQAKVYAEFEREDGHKASTPWRVSASLRIVF